MSAVIDQPIVSKNQAEEMMQVLAQSRNLLENPMAYERYDSSRLVAPRNDMQRMASERAGQVGQWLPFLQEARTMSRNADRAYPDEYRRYTNPFEQAAINAVTRDVSRNFTENVLPALEAKFLRAGQHGSSGHRDLVNRAHRNMQTELMARLGQMRAHGYELGARQHEAEQNRRAQISRNLADLGITQQAAHIADIGTLKDIGGMNQQMEQNRLNALYDLWLREKAAPYERLQMRAAILQGLPFQPGATRMFAQPPEPQLNTSGKLGSLAMALIGARRKGVV
jgi:hypothetical protein